MTIFKKSKMDLDTTVLIQPVKLKKEAVDGLHGPQDEWWIKLDGEDATTYTDYYVNKETGSTRPDNLGTALRQALPTESTVTVTKGFDKSKNRAAYNITVGEGKADTAPPAQSKGPGVSDDYKRERDKKQREQELAGKIKGLQIAYQGIGKFMGIATETPAENHARIVAQFELMEKWAEDRAKSNPADPLYKAIDAANLGVLTEQFIGWLANHYKQTALEELSETQIAHALENLGAAIEAFHGQQDAEEERQRDQSIIAEPDIPEDQPPF